MNPRSKHNKRPSLVNSADKPPASPGTLLNYLQMLSVLVVLVLCNHAALFAAGEPKPAEKPVPGAPAAKAELIAVLKSLAGTEWRLENLCGVAAVAKYQASLVFAADGNISGRGSVNRFGGKIQATGNSLKVGPLMSTEMASEPAAMAQEAKYLKALQSATALVVEGDELRITCAGQERPLVFSKINKP